MSARFAFLALCLASSAHAEVFKHVEAGSGLMVISNVPPKQTGQQAQPRVMQNDSPAAFPTVGKQRQKELDGGRRAILEQEMASEQQALQTARLQKAAADIIARHNANLAALTRELSGVR
ncbi:hypothetical protein [Massilia sp. CF038]|uniref:hypothetical protein n=1 Tax=Massilia sp. CF038 TaxID=1881045 RepID=UPI000916E9E5|nr:hypothetical protein [Massilia sp. CF038]SHH24649.1 hypothetical protein SAMN05428948_3497 [Massilia sp. CF038]